MNTNSMPTPTPGPESNDRHGDLKTPEQRTIAYRLGRALQLRGAVSIGLVVFVVALCFLSALCFDSFVKYDDSEIVGGAIICIVIAGFVILAWIIHRNECDLRRTPADPPAPAPQSNPVPPTTCDWTWSWSSFLGMGIAFYGMRDRSDESRRNGVARIQQQGQYEVGQQARARQLQATMSYWQTSVVNFHHIRFQLPAGDEPAGKFLEDMFDSLRQLTDRAKAAPTADVDQDLVTMATRHLAVEDRMIQFKAYVEELMKRDNIPAPAGTDTMDQRMTQWQSIVARIDADPSIFDNLPQGPTRTLLETVMELEQQRLEQLREIEIMQARLQERYPGTQFPLTQVGM